MKSGFFLSFACASVLVSALSAPAVADEVRERAARKACLLGDTAKGMEILTDLYLDTKDPNFIFNQGRCLEQNSRYADAIARLREYLIKGTSLSGEERANAEKHIADCQSWLGKKPDEGATAAGASKPGAGDVASAGGLPVQSESSSSESALGVAASPVKPSPGSGLRTAGTVTAATGGLSLIAGVILNIKANNAVDELQGRFSRGDQPTADAYKTWSIVGYGVGGACLAGGALLYYLGWRTGGSGRGTLFPSVTPDFATLHLTGAF